MRNSILALAICAASAVSVSGQQAVTLGKGSYAAYPPPYKAQTSEHSGFQATKMLTRKIWADENDKNGNPRPIPTNDWWTDVINNRYSGALWSYPAMLHTGEYGVKIDFPKRWNTDGDRRGWGQELKSDSHIIVSAVKFEASETRASDWHDWDVEITMPDKHGKGEITATLVQGNPFTFFEFNGLVPQITFSATPQVIRRDGADMLLKIGEDFYGLYTAKNAKVEMLEDALRLQNTEWLSVALLGKEADFETYAPYSSSIVRDTKLTWKYDEKTSLLSTRWEVSAEDLDNPGMSGAVIQGFLPHAYKHAVSQNFINTQLTYLVPRGLMKMATGNVFEYSYRFSGILPYYARPKSGNLAENDFSEDIMKQLVSAYAAGGSFGGDTYWGGKGLIQMALNMTFAKEMGYADLYEESKTKLRNKLVDWLTYKPGEDKFFFAYYPRWGGMLGFDVSYDSDAFNDHHFHYGYMLYASALMCLEDKSFAEDYGGVLTLIAKDYANYDREDTRFPFLRTLNPWFGHSFAGGLGDAGNDNGNGQESSSEAMQGWGGVYMLGVALGDKEMRDAGIFGWLTESRGTLEYWFDRDHVHAADRETVYDNTKYNYDYTKYTRPYNTNITCKGIGWWTWFSGDPLWMHSIQWMPVSPLLNYMSEDLTFAKWDIDTMLEGTAYDWFETRTRPLDDGKTETLEPLANQSVGNVVLAYMERSRPSDAAAIFQRAWNENFPIAKSVDTGHISYFVIHNHLTYGEIDFGVSADCPTANAYRTSTGKYTYIVYNPDEETRTVRFYRNGSIVKSVKAPGNRLTAFDADPVASSIETVCAEGGVVPPGGSSEISARVLDQYGVDVDGAVAEWTVSGPATVSGNKLKINANAQKGSKVTLTATSGKVSGSLEVTVNDKPVAKTTEVTGLPEFAETGFSGAFTLKVTDQYGKESTPDAVWTVTDFDGKTYKLDGNVFVFERGGKYQIKGESNGSVAASASAELRILPPLPNGALGCKAWASSAENAATEAAGAFDGDMSKRWGSKHFDEEWLAVDLGEDHFISSVTLYWEAAYGKDYDIQVASDGVAVGNDGCPIENTWSKAGGIRGQSAPGEVNIQLGVRGRYVRMKGVKRGSNYGYSLYEMKVHAVPCVTSSDTPVGIDITVAPTVKQGETATLSASTITFGGDRIPNKDVRWSCVPASDFIASRLRPRTYGVHTVTAVSGDLSASATLMVEESMKLDKLTVTPAEFTIREQDSMQLEVEGLNQFGGLYPVSSSEFPVKVTDAEGHVVSSSDALYDADSGVFTGMKPGVYILDFSGRANSKANVVSFADYNIALNQRAWASSSKGDAKPAKAVDGDLGSRWESRHSTDAGGGVDVPEFLAVDFGSLYKLNRVRLTWEAAYAKDFSLEVSADGETWHEAKSVKDWNGKSMIGGEEKNLVFEYDMPEGAYPEVQYVRVMCTKRNLMEYGYSIYELEAYGIPLFSGVDSLPGFDDSDAEPEYYNLQGMRIGNPTPGSIVIIRRGNRTHKVIF